MAGRWSAVVVLALVAATASADETAQIRADVAAASPEAAALLDEARVARDADRLPDAITAYEKAIALAPKVDHLYRELCLVELGLIRIDAAHGHCDRAVYLAPKSPYNIPAFVQVLLARGQPVDIESATILAEKHVKTHPEHPAVLEAWCRTLIEQDEHRRDRDRIRACSARWVRAAPTGLASNLYATAIATDDGDYDEARARLAKAKAAGLDAEVYASFAAEIDAAEAADAIFPRWVHVVFWIFLAWLGALFLLFVVGMTLSRQPTSRAYKSVLVVAGLYFFVTIPMVVGLLVAIAVGALMVTWTIGKKMWIGVLIATIVGYAVFAIARALFAQVRAPGKRVDLAKLPQLRELLDEVARATDARPVDNVYLAPYAEIAIVDRGGVAAALRGERPERALILGIGAFEGMTLAQLRSILAHEYARARHRDTAGGAFTLAIQRSLSSLDERLHLAGVARGNPGWWFLRAFAAMYGAITGAASHLEQTVAARRAIEIYGSATFIAMNEHLARRGLDLELQLADTLKDVVEKKCSLGNLYDYEPAVRRTSEAERATAIAERLALARPLIAIAEELAVEAPADASVHVWSLFAGRDELERMMTDVVREELRATSGLDIPKPPSVSAAS